MTLRLTAFVLVAALIAGCGGSKTADIPSGGSSSTASTTSTGASSTPASSAPAGCRSVAKPAPKPDGKLAKPSLKLNAAKRYTATVTTNCGVFAFSLDAASAPHAAASIAYLASKHFFDQTRFHRIVPGFVIQGGDPTGTGNGGPGYSTHDKSQKSWTYKLGSVAMAKTGSEPAGTAGSQFFVVTGADAGLPPDYAVVGKVTRGLDVVRRIGTLGDQSEQPTFDVVIQSLRVTSR